VKVCVLIERSAQITRFRTVCSVKKSAAEKARRGLYRRDWLGMLALVPDAQI
jgi:hypothetical protein